MDLQTAKQVIARAGYCCIARAELRQLVAAAGICCTGTVVGNYEIDDTDCWALETAQEMYAALRRWLEESDESAAPA